MLVEGIGQIHRAVTLRTCGSELLIACGLSAILLRALSTELRIAFPTVCRMQ